jgi:Mor transcription activator family
MASSHSESVSLLPPEITPKVLLLIADYCGDSIALDIWRHYGGGHLFVPESITADHHLAIAIGLGNAQAVSEQFGGESLCIPRGKKALDAVRNTLIKARRKQGWSLFALARENHLTTRQILTILAGKILVDENQLDLFK